MKYTGRITLLLLSLSVSLIEFILGRDLDISEVFLDTIMAGLSWFIGGLYDKLIFVSYRDYLTKVYNRRYGGKVIPKLLEKAKLRKEPLTIFSLDIDNFKSLNDNYGHEAGDRALEKLSDLLVKLTRKSDLVVRWGGDEFLFVTPNLDKESVTKLIEHINNAAQLELSEFNNDNMQLGISIGFATFPEDGHELDKLVSISDKKMYKVKASSK